MRTYLIIANQTLGGDALRDEIVARIADGPPASTSSSRRRP